MSAGPSGSARLTPVAEPAGPMACTGVPLPRFRDFQNGRQRGLDIVQFCFYLGIILTALLKFSLSSTEAAHYVALGIFLAACLAWASLAPRTYTAWREWVIAAVRLWSLAAPANAVILRDVLQKAAPWRLGNDSLACLFFLVLLPFVTGAVSLAQFALTARLGLLAHLAVHALALPMSLAFISPVCACGVMQQDQSVAMVHKLHVIFDILSLRLVDLHPPGLDCWAVLAQLQVILGYVFPTILLGLFECEEYRHFSRFHRGRHEISWYALLCGNTPAGVPFPDAGWPKRLKFAIGCQVLFAALWEIIRMYALRGS